MANSRPPDIRQSLPPLPKRRRISHSHSPPPLAPSSTVATGISGTPRRTPNRSPIRNPHRRASYLSPTKASLARFNPKLLRKSSVKDTPALTPTREGGGDERTRSPPRPKVARNDTTTSHRPDEIVLQTRTQDSMRDSAHLYRRNASAKSNEESHDDATQSVPRLDTSASRGKNALAYVLGKSNEAPKDGASQQQQRPDLPMNDPSERDNQSATPGSRLQNVVNAVISDLEQTRTPEMPGHFALVPFRDDDDDPLPETPSGARYEPPKGILSSGARRMGKRKPLKDKRVDDDTSQTDQERPHTQQVTTRRSEPTVVQALVTNSARAENSDAQAAVQLSDKKRKLDALQEEVNKTKEDIEMWAKYLNDDNGSGDDKELIDLIVGPSIEVSKSAQPSLSTLLASFLPFSLPISNSIQNEDAEDGSNDDSIPSHTPIAEADPLPLLQRFTPFKITSTIHAPTEVNVPAQSGSEGRRGREGRPVLLQDGEQVAGTTIDQQHTITLQSPSNHLSCTLDLTITTTATQNSAPQVSALQFTHISPWARREIGPWLNARIADKDLAVLGYGLGRYYDIAVRRASCWAKCHTTFPALVEGVEENAVPQLMKQRDTSAPQRQIEYYLGRDSIVLRDRNAMLRVKWEIEFDWTGEVESRLYARARFPEVWYEMDERQGLRKVPTVFDRLVRERGVFEAVEIMSGVIFRNDE